MSARLELMEQVLDCEACELHAQCTAPVFMSSPTSASVTFSQAAGLIPKIAVLGEAPGEQEDAAGSPFIGPAGQLLREVLREAGIDPQTVTYINTVSCFPHGTPEPVHVKACAANREAQLAFSGATHVLCVGKIATKAIEPALEMKHGRGRPFLVNDRLHFSTWHPAAALRNGNYEQEMIEDIKTFAALCQVGPTRWREFIGLTCSACPKECAWVQESGLTWCLEHVPGADFAEAQAAVERNRRAYESLKATAPLTDEKIIWRNETPVGKHHPETSKIAAAAALPNSGTRKGWIYEAIKEAGTEGMTDKQLEAHIEEDHEAVSAARNALMNSGQIFDSGQKRPTPKGKPATVWVIERFAPQAAIDTWRGMNIVDL